MDDASNSAARPVSPILPPDDSPDSPQQSAVILAKANAAFFHTPSNDAYAKVNTGRRDVMPVQSETFRLWIQAEYYKTAGSALSKTETDRAIETLTAHARFSCDEDIVYLRTAKHNGKYYIDLCNSIGQIVEIDEKGWMIASASPVKFIRPPTMRALPMPEAGKPFKQLLPLINIPKGSWCLLLAWLIECLRPDTPYVGLELFGLQGSAKSSTQTLLRELIDPNEVNLRANANKREDIFVACHSSHLVSYENLSRLNTDRQDALCTILTGGGYAARTMRTNVDETVINVKRPVVLNGIANVVTNPDLLDRFLSIEMLTITTANRRTDAELHAEFELKKGQIFGAILKWFSRCLQKLPEVAEQNLDLPRMGDFALLGEALMQSLNRKPGDFIARYQRNQNRSVVQAIESSPLGAAIVSYLSCNPGGLSGSYTHVSDTLRDHAASVSGKTLRAKDWPADNGEFGTALRRLIPALERKRVRVTTKRKNTGHICRINLMK